MYLYYNCCQLIALSTQNYQPVEGQTHNENYFGCKIKPHTVTLSQEQLKVLAYLKGNMIRSLQDVSTYIQHFHEEYEGIKDEDSEDSTHFAVPVAREEP